MKIVFVFLSERFVRFAYHQDPGKARSGRTVKPEDEETFIFSSLVKGLLELIIWAYMVH